MIDQSAVLYLDFVKDVEEEVEILRKDGIKAGKYTGQMTVEDRKQSEKLFLQGDILVLVATESYELGVDNPNINQVITTESWSLASRIRKSRKEAWISGNWFITF